MPQRHHKKRLLVCLLLPFLLSYCATHRLEIPQGTPVKESSLAQLKVGMTPQEVERILGTAPIKDPFHDGRWDYVFYTTAKDTPTQKSHVVLQFDQGALKKIERKY